MWFKLVCNRNWWYTQIIRIHRKSFIQLKFLNLCIIETFFCRLKKRKFATNTTFFSKMPLSLIILWNRKHSRIIYSSPLILSKGRNIMHWIIIHLFILIKSLFIHLEHLVYRKHLIFGWILMILSFFITQVHAFLFLNFFKSLHCVMFIKIIDKLEILRVTQCVFILFTLLLNQSWILHRWINTITG